MDKYGEKIKTRDWVRVEEEFTAKNVNGTRNLPISAEIFFRIKNVSEKGTAIVDYNGDDWLLDTSKLKRLQGHVDVLMLTPFHGQWVRLDIEKLDSTGKLLNQMFTEKGLVESVSDGFVNITNALPATSGHATVSHPIVCVRGIELLKEPDSTVEGLKF
jgi:hypothetical protein